MRVLSIFFYMVKLKVNLYFSMVKVKIYLGQGTVPCPKSSYKVQKSIGGDSLVTLGNNIIVLYAFHRN